MLRVWSRLALAPALAMTFALAWAAILSLSAADRSIVHAATLCVKPGGGSGCFNSITAALAAAQNGDVIRVAADTYTEDVVITRSVTLEGGWDSAFSARDPAANVTIIRPADLAQAVVTIQGTFGDAAALTPTLDGFTITDARSDNHGGVSIQAATVTLTGNTIISNTANTTASGFGGGVYMVGSRAFTLTDNTIMTNTAGHKYSGYLSGGGLQIRSGRGTLSGNVIADNRANRAAIFGNGGGLAVFTSTLYWQGDRIINNSTAANCEGYGGLYASNSAITLDATQVERNCAANTPFYGLGGGLAFVNSPYTLTNALVINNYAFPSQDADACDQHRHQPATGCRFSSQGRLARH